MVKPKYHLSSSSFRSHVTVDFVVSFSNTMEFQIVRMKASCGSLRGAFFLAALPWLIAPPPQLTVRVGLALQPNCVFHITVKPISGH